MIPETGVPVEQKLGFSQKVLDAAAYVSGQFFTGKMVARQQEVAADLQMRRTEYALAFLKGIPSMKTLINKVLLETPLPDGFVEPDDGDWDAPTARDSRIYAAMPRLFASVRPNDAPGMVNTAHEVGLGSSTSPCGYCARPVYPATDAYDLVAWQEPQDVTHISYDHASLDPFPAVRFTGDLQGEVRQLLITKEDAHVLAVHPLTEAARNRTNEVMEFADAFERWNAAHNL